MKLEHRFPTTFIAKLAKREKQIQQTYRPNIGIHKWFARRPGTLFRGLLLSEFADRAVQDVFFQGNVFSDKTIADPFMGGGTPLIEANRLGMKVIGADINPMAYWVVRQSLSQLNLDLFRAEAQRVSDSVEQQIGDLYVTTCVECGHEATVKYFLWVKTANCAECGTANDLFPGFLVAKNDRHPKNVWYCPTCQNLSEIDQVPDKTHSVECVHCHQPLPYGSTATRGKFNCCSCDRLNSYPHSEHPPHHRLFAMEYHCQDCRGNGHQGRFFKVPDANDLQHLKLALEELSALGTDWLPSEEIPSGDESDRLHKWGYRYYTEMFNTRQLLALQILMREIAAVHDNETRFALATVFSDMLRYQNMLCRYDTMALKCQDIFSVHGFPVGLVQCENNLLGIPGVGSGGFRHFVEKYIRAKEYGLHPFEVSDTKKKEKVPTTPELIAASFVEDMTAIPERGALLKALDAAQFDFLPNSLDGVFTDPPYYDNVQYAELMDFCFVWLRRLLSSSFGQFEGTTTRNAVELTGNETMGRGIFEFTEGLSSVFQNVAEGLKLNAPLVFTYHHNDPIAYLPVIIAILDSGLPCTATLASPAEMSASLHINGTGSSIIDSIFVCRKMPVTPVETDLDVIRDSVFRDVESIQAAGVKVTVGDIVCIVLGHVSRMVIGRLQGGWNAELPIIDRYAAAKQEMDQLVSELSPVDLANEWMRSENTNLGGVV